MDFASSQPHVSDSRLASVLRFVRDFASSLTCDFRSQHRNFCFWFLLTVSVTHSDSWFGLGFTLFDSGFSSSKFIFFNLVSASFRFGFVVTVGSVLPYSLSLGHIQQLFDPISDASDSSFQDTFISDAADFASDVTDFASDAKRTDLASDAADFASDAAATRRTDFASDATDFASDAAATRRNSTRIRHQPTHLKDYICSSSSCAAIPTSSKSFLGKFHDMGTLSWRTLELKWVNHFEQDLCTAQLELDCDLDPISDASDSSFHTFISDAADFASDVTVFASDAKRTDLASDAADFASEAAATRRTDFASDATDFASDAAATRRNSTRIRHQPTHLKDYICPSSSCAAIPTSSKST